MKCLHWATYDFKQPLRRLSALAQASMYSAVRLQLHWHALAAAPGTQHCGTSFGREGQLWAGHLDYGEEPEFEALQAFF